MRTISIIGFSILFTVILWPNAAQCQRWDPSTFFLKDTTVTSLQLDCEKQDCRAMVDNITLFDDLHSLALKNLSTQVTLQGLNKATSLRKLSLHFRYEKTHIENKHTKKWWRKNQKHVFKTSQLKHLHLENIFVRSFSGKMKNLKNLQTLSLKNANPNRARNLYNQLKKIQIDSLMLSGHRYYLPRRVLFYWYGYRNYFHKNMSKLDSLDYLKVDNAFEITKDPPSGVSFDTLKVKTLELEANQQKKNPTLINPYNILYMISMFQPDSFITNVYYNQSPIIQYFYKTDSSLKSEELWLNSETTYTKPTSTVHIGKIKTDTTLDVAYSDSYLFVDPDLLKTLYLTDTTSYLKRYNDLRYVGTTLSPYQAKQGSKKYQKKRRAFYSKFGFKLVKHPKNGTRVLQFRKHYKNPFFKKPDRQIQSFIFSEHRELTPYLSSYWKLLKGDPRAFSKKYWSDVNMVYLPDENLYKFTLKNENGFEDFYLARILPDTIQEIKKSTRTFNAARRSKMRYVKRFNKKIPKTYRRTQKRLYLEKKRDFRSFRRKHLSPPEKVMSLHQWIRYYKGVVANENIAIQNLQPSQLTLQRALDLAEYKFLPPHYFYKTFHKGYDTTSVHITQGDSTEIPVISLFLIDSVTKTYTFYQSGYSMSTEFNITFPKDRKLKCIALQFPNIAHIGSIHPDVTLKTLASIPEEDLEWFEKVDIEKITDFRTRLEIINRYQEIQNKLIPKISCKQLPPIITDIGLIMSQLKINL